MMSYILRMMFHLFLEKRVDGDSRVPDSWDVKTVKSEKNNFGCYLRNADKLLLLTVKDAGVLKCVESVKKEEFKRTRQKDKLMR